MKSVITAISTAALILLGVSACAANGTTSRTASEALPSTVKVVYEVDGTATGADITVETGTGTSQQSVKVPLTSKSGTTGLTFQMERGSFVYISAQNKGRMRAGANATSSDFYGSVTCRIKVNGKVISENTTTSKYGIASCDGKAG